MVTAREVEGTRAATGLDGGSGRATLRQAISSERAYRRATYAPRYRSSAPAATISRRTGQLTREIRIVQRFLNGGTA